MRLLPSLRPSTHLPPTAAAPLQERAGFSLGCALTLQVTAESLLSVCARDSVLRSEEISHSVDHFSSRKSPVTPKIHQLATPRSGCVSSPYHQKSPVTPQHHHSRPPDPNVCLSHNSPHPAPRLGRTGAALCPSPVPLPPQRAAQELWPWFQHQGQSAWGHHRHHSWLASAKATQRPHLQADSESAHSRDSCRMRINSTHQVPGPGRKRCAHGLSRPLAGPPRLPVILLGCVVLPHTSLERGRPHTPMQPGL